MAKPAKLSVSPPSGLRNARPCSIYFGQIQAKTQADFTTPLPKFEGHRWSYAPCGYTGPQFRAAYEANSNLDGTGTTVAIVGAYAAPTLAEDTNEYATLNGDGGYVSGQFTQTVASNFTNAALCDPSGWSSEQTLDVEAVHAMAPAANIHHYGAASCLDNDLIDALDQVVIDDQANWSPTRGARPKKASWPIRSRHTRRSSCKAPSRVRASCSPPATTVTNSRTPASDRPTTQLRTRT
jgi:hypothetical protein